jgi:hypothetical protein
MPCVYATPRYCPASCHPKSHLGSICSVYDSVCTEHMCTYKSCSPPGLQVQQEEAAAAAQNPVAQSSHAAGPLFALCFPASHAMHSSSVESYPRLVYVWKSHGRNIYARSHTRAQAQIILLACTQALSPKLLTSVVTSGACPVWQLQLVPCPGPAHVRVCLCFSPGPTSMHEDEAKRSAGLYTVERQGAARTGGVRVPEEEEQKPYPAQCQEHRICYEIINGFVFFTWYIFCISRYVVHGQRAHCSWCRASGEGRT